MRRLVVCSYVLGIVMISGGSQLRAADNIAGPLKTQWDSIRNLMVKTVQAVPEDKYDFKPVAGVYSFRELFIHVAGENYFFMSRASGEKPPEQKLDGLKTRDEIVKALNDSYDYGTKVLAGMTDEKAVETITGPGGKQMPRWAAALGNIVDNMDHYGNLVVYMRINGIVPPSTAARQQRQ